MRLQAALEGLEQDLREVILLRLIEGRPLAEVAERLERSESAVRRLAARAAAELGRALGREEVGNG